MKLCAALFFFNDTATTEIYTLSLHDALPILTKSKGATSISSAPMVSTWARTRIRSEEHTSELQSLRHLVCRLLLEKKNQRSADLGTIHDPLAELPTDLSS